MQDEGSNVEKMAKMSFSRSQVEAFSSDSTESSPIGLKSLTQARTHEFLNFPSASSQPSWKKLDPAVIRKCESKKYGAKPNVLEFSKPLFKPPEKRMGALFNDPWDFAKHSGPPVRNYSDENIPMDRNCSEYEQILKKARNNVGSVVLPKTVNKENSVRPAVSSTRCEKYERKKKSATLKPNTT